MVILKSIDKSWENIWEKVFQYKDFGKYPSEELIRFTANYFYKFARKKQIKFLDLGCGTGSNSWYLAREGFTVYGVDGSKTAILKTKRRFRKENVKGTFSVMDYVRLDFPDNYFDAVIDIVSIEHNPIENVPIILNEIRRVLKPRGKLFSMLVSTGTFYKPFKNLGYVHFYKLHDIKRLFQIFKILSIERNERTKNNMKDRVIHWCVSCEK